MDLSPSGATSLVTATLNRMTISPPYYKYNKGLVDTTKHLYMVQNMSGSRSGLLDPVLEGVEPLLQKESRLG